MISIANRKKKMKKLHFAFLGIFLSLSTLTFAGLGAWSQIGPYGGEVVTIAGDPSNPKVIYAGTLGAGLLKSTNGGQLWEKTPGFCGSHLSALLIQEGTVYVGIQSAGYICKSVDEGKTLTVIKDGLPKSTISSLAAIGTTLFAATSDSGIYRSTNGGANWLPANSGLSDFRIKSLTVNGTTLFAVSEFGGIYKSLDLAENWNVSNTGFLGSPTTLLVVGTNLLVGTTGGSIYRSSDNGANWVTASDMFINAPVSKLVGKGVHLFAATGGGGIYRSDSNGTNWIAVETGLPVSPVTSILAHTIAVSGDVLLTGIRKDGMYRSVDDGNHWIESNAGLANKWVQALAVSGTTIIAGVFGDGIQKSTDDGATWSSTNTGLTNGFVYALAISGTNVYAATSTGVFKSSNLGSSWAPINVGLTSTDVRALLIDGASVYAGTFPGGVFRSANNGASWTAVNTGLSDTFVTSLAKKGTTLFAGTLSGGVYRSTDGGNQWNQSVAGLGDPIPFVGHLDVNHLASNDEAVYAGTDQGVFKSTDNGTNWTGPIIGTSGRRVFSMFGYRTSLFAYVYDPIRLIAALNHWRNDEITEFARDVDESDVRVFAASGDSIYLGTSNRSIYSLTRKLEFANLPPLDGVVFSQFNYPFTIRGAWPAVKVTLASGQLPPGLFLGFGIAGVPTTAGVFSGTIRVSDALSPDATQDFHITIRSQPRVTNVPPIGEIGVAYEFSFTTEGTAPIQFKVASGALPPGLELSSAGVIHGIPTTPGSYSVTLEFSNGGPSVLTPFGIVIAAPVTIDSGPPVAGLIGVPYRHSFSSKGTPPFSFAISGGGLPPGLNLLSLAGEIQGIPTTAGTYIGSVTVSGADGAQSSQDFSIVITNGNESSSGGGGGGGCTVSRNGRPDVGFLDLIVFALIWRNKNTRKHRVLEHLR